MNRYEVTPSIQEILIEGDKATIKVTENYIFIASDRNQKSETGTIYEIKSINSEGKWLITEITSDCSFESAFKEIGINIDEILLLKSLNTMTDDDKNKDVAKKMVEQEEMIRKLNLSYTSYDRNKAKQYALEYSTFANPFNEKFWFYAGVNCQNFASQAVWYGLGGEDNQQAINSKQFPMLDLGKNHERSWYQTVVRYDCPTNWSWTGVEYFQDYMSAGGYFTVGPYGHLFSGVAWADIGDIIQVDWGATGSWFDHAYVVVAVDGTLGSRTPSNIWVSAHTNRVHNKRLSTEPGSYYRTIKIAGYMIEPL